MSTLPTPTFLVHLRERAADLADRGVLALGPLFDLAAPRLLRFAQTIARTPHDAEDAVQAAMVRIARQPQLLAGAMHPWAYFLQVVRNELLQQIRRDSRGANSFVSLELAGYEFPSLQQAVHNEARDAVREAVRLLPADQAEVVVLKIWEEMTFAEIGEILNESSHTVASRYRYALQKLSRLLQPFAEGQVAVPAPVHHG